MALWSTYTETTRNKPSFQLKKPVQFRDHACQICFYFLSNTVGSETRKEHSGVTNPSYLQRHMQNPSKWRQDSVFIYPVFLLKHQNLTLKAKKNHVSSSVARRHTATHSERFPESLSLSLSREEPLSLWSPSPTYPGYA